MSYSEFIYVSKLCLWKNMSEWLTYLQQNVMIHPTKSNSYFIEYSMWDRQLSNPAGTRNVDAYDMVVYCAIWQLTKY